NTADSSTDITSNQSAANFGFPAFTRRTSGICTESGCLSMRGPKMAVPAQLRISIAHIVSDASFLPSPEIMALAVRNRLPGWADVQWLEATESTNTDLLMQARADQDLPRLRGTHLQHQGRG